MVLTTRTASELSSMLDKREVSSEEVTRAHLDRIHTIDGEVGAFVSVHEADAIAAARRADAARARGEASGALFGLPVSVKENLDFEGRASTLGIVARRGHRAARDATIIRALRSAGAVILGQTNVPQLLLSHETRNPLFGVTVNVFSGDHAPGGSSGGEASSLAAGMSPLGIGTDIGGSIRVPAHWSGIVGFKPTLDRWSSRGSNGALPGQETIRAQVGPMARTVDDLVLLLRGLDVLEMSEDDPMVPPLPFGDPGEVDVTKLRIGFFADDGIVAPSAAVARAVDSARRALEAAGASAVPFAPPDMREALGLYFAAMSADGGRTAWSRLEGSAAEPTLAPLKRLASLPAPARRLLVRTLRLLGERRPAMVVERLGEKSVQALWGITKLARDYRYDLMRAMKSAGVHVLLCPPHATPAVPHEKSPEFLSAGSYSMLFNLVQFPAGVVPVTTVRAGETHGRKGGGDRVEGTAREVDARSEGLPVGVQLAGLPFRDEQVLAAMRVVEQGVKTAPGHPEVPRAPAKRAGR